MPKKVTAFKARTHLGQILDDVRYQKIPYIIERNGRPIVVILDIEEYRRVEQLLFMEQFIEEYTNERIKEFMSEDKIDKDLEKRINKQLKI